MSNYCHCMAIPITEIAMQLSASSERIMCTVENPNTNWPNCCFLHRVSNRKNYPSASTKKETLRERSQMKMDLHLKEINGFRL